MAISTFSWQTKVTKMCPKYLLTLHQNWSSQYQMQINRTGDINKVKNFYSVDFIFLPFVIMGFIVEFWNYWRVTDEA